MAEKRNVRVLVLEDSPERIKAFKAFFGVHNDFVFDADFTDDADHAVALLQEKQHDLLLLDHDLGEGSNPDPENNGKRFTERVLELEGNILTSFAIVHSLNFGGASRMVEDLRQAGITATSIPFVWNAMNRVMSLYLRQKRLGDVMTRRIKD